MEEELEQLVTSAEYPDLYYDPHGSKSLDPKGPQYKTRLQMWQLLKEHEPKVVKRMGLILNKGCAGCGGPCKPEKRFCFYCPAVELTKNQHLKIVFLQQQKTFVGPERQSRGSKSPSHEGSPEPCGKGRGRGRPRGSRGRA